MRIGILRLVLLLTAVVVGGGFSFATSCPGPTVDVVGAEHRIIAFRPGEEVSIEGRFWGDFPCDDTGGSSVFGCSEQDDADPGRPYQNISIYVAGPVTHKVWRAWAQEGVIADTAHERKMLTVDADATGSFSASFVMPELPSGRYFIHGGDRGSPTQVEIR